MMKYFAQYNNNNNNFNLNIHMLYLYFIYKIKYILNSYLVHHNYLYELTLNIRFFAKYQYRS